MKDFEAITKELCMLKTGFFDFVLTQPSKIKFVTF